MHGRAAGYTTSATDQPSPFAMTREPSGRGFRPLLPRQRVVEFTAILPRLILFRLRPMRATEDKLDGRFYIGTCDNVDETSSVLTRRFPSAASPLPR
jgi:hypothetical protein